jgi:hypothetical protein
MEPEGSLLLLQVPATYPYPQPKYYSCDQNNRVSWEEQKCTEGSGDKT